MFRKLVPHLCIITALILLTLSVLDVFNPGLNLAGNLFARIVLAVGCLSSLAAAGLLLGSKKG